MDKLYRVEVRCPVCLAKRFEALSKARLHTLSWERFPNQPSCGEFVYETGLVKLPCGSEACERVIKQRVGVRFKMWRLDGRG